MKYTTAENTQENPDITGFETHNRFIARFLAKFQMLVAALILLPVSFSAAADHPAQELVEDAVNTVMSDLKSDGTDNLDGTIERNIIPHLDFVTMTRLSVGKNWNKASTEQQQTLVSEFKTFLLNTYRSALSEYGGETVEFKAFKKPKRDDRAMVASVFKYGSNKVPVEYKLHNRTGPWKVYDIIVSDLSLVIQYKSSFSAEIDRNGIDGLIKLLQDKNKA